LETERAINSDIDDFQDLDPGEELLHDRTYRVRAYRRSAQELRLRGMVRDIKPAGLYVEGDPAPLQVHHMVVDLIVSYPDMTITAVDVQIETHPHDGCPRIADHYQKLVGLSISRGFTHQVRELFGGPRGCTHTTALLLAMGPVATQSIWPMEIETRRAAGTGEAEPSDGRMAGFRAMVNSCHYWAEGGEAVTLIRAGERPGPPRWMKQRMIEQDQDPATWSSPLHG
jgi:Protein of unknown function (DUF2889)